MDAAVRIKVDKYCAAEAKWDSEEKIPDAGRGWLKNGSEEQSDDGEFLKVISA